MSTTTAPNLTLKVKKWIKAPPARVFAAWTTPEQIRQWLGPGCEMPVAEIDARTGGEYSLKMVSPRGEFPVHGVYREVNPPKRLVFTWATEGGCACASGEAGADAMTVSETLVTVDFAEMNGGTEVTIRHELFTDAPTRDRHNDGWTGSLENLEKVLAGEKVR